MKMTLADVQTMVTGAIGWTVAISIVKVAGKGVAVPENGRHCRRHVSIAPPVCWDGRRSTKRCAELRWRWVPPRSLMAWRISFIPRFTTRIAMYRLDAPGNIFFGAGLLGIFSAYV